MRFAFFPEFLGHIRHVVKIAQVMLKKNFEGSTKNNYFLDLCAFLEDSSSNPPPPNLPVLFHYILSSTSYGDGLVESRHSLYVCSSEWETHFCIDLWEFISLLAS